MITTKVSGRRGPRHLQRRTVRRLRRRRPALPDRRGRLARHLRRLPGVVHRQRLGRRHGTTRLPLIASARALFVNNDLLEQAGVADSPTTWDELLDAAKKISALGGGVAGYGMPLGSEEAQAEAAVWLWGGGGTFGDATEITVDTPANLPGAEQIKKMVDAGATQADAGSTDRSPLMDIFIQGKIGMQVGLPPTVGQIAEDNPDLNYSIVPDPHQGRQPVHRSASPTT